MIFNREPKFMKRINCIKPKAELISGMVLALAFGFMLFIFAPIDTYYANMNEYWFTMWQMLSVCMALFFAYLVISGIIMIVFSKSAFFVQFQGILLSIYIYMYIQGNYIPRNYGVMNGAEMEWSEYSSYSVASAILGLFCVTFCVVVLFKFKNSIPSIVKKVVLFILAIQMITIVVLGFNNNKKHDEQTVVTTSKDLFEYSKDNNIIVILLDAYDGGFLNYCLETDYQRTASIFKDFTYYSDSLGGYPTTKCSLPLILTGKWYQNEISFSDYIKMAYNNNEVYKLFKKKKYDLDVYANLMYLSPDSIEYNNIEVGEYYISDKVLFANVLFKVVAFNYMPNQIKRFFVYDTEMFSDLKKSTTLSPNYSGDSIMFYKQLSNEGVSVSRKGNVFKFYHLEGTHPPFTFGEEINEDGGEYSAYDEALGCNIILSELFDELKDKNVFDSSTIIVMADHGQIGFNQNPIFMIKNKEEKHDFIISDTKMSWSYLKDIWLSLINDTKVDEKKIQSFYSDEKKRRFLFYRWDDAWQRTYMPAMEEMYCEGVASDINCLKATGKTYIANTEDHTYRLGDVLDFVDGRTAYTHVLYGIAFGEVAGEAAMQFDIEEPFDNLQIRIGLNQNCGNGIVNILANDQIVAEKIYGGKEDNITIIVPHEYVEEGALRLSFTADGINSETAPFDQTHLIIYDIVITSTNEKYDVDSQKDSYEYKLGEVLDFSSTGNADFYERYGFSVMEDWGTWTLGNEACLRFRTDADTDLKCVMNYNVFGNNQRVTIIINDNVVENYTATGSEEHTILIPKDILNGEFVDIRFELPDAFSPASMNNGNGDPRELALGFISMSLSETGQ